MKNFLPKILVAMLLLLSQSSQLFATHIAGADLTYEYLGTNGQGQHQYRIELTVYRDCDGVAAPTSPELNYSSNLLDYDNSINLTMDNPTGEEITVPCQSGVTTCSGGDEVGIQRYVYHGTVTLPNVSSDWVFSWQLCCRNCSITTITNQANCTNSSTGNSTYVAATLDNTSYQHNSPFFSNNPISFVCADQDFTYNHGAIQPGGDSIAYELVPPKRNAGLNIAYFAPYSYTNPLASTPALALNAINGDLTMHPTMVGQITVMAVLVKHYHDGDLVGSVVRDMQIYVVSCDNELPFTLGIDDTEIFSISVCPNQELCFEVNSYDDDLDQDVTMSWNGGIAGASFIITPGSRPSAQFCWTPDFSDINLIPHSFTVTVQDDNCPTNGLQTYSFNITVPSPFFDLTATDVTCPGGNDGTATATPQNVNSNYDYLWSNGETTSSISGLIAGTYDITVTDEEGCSTTTSIEVEQPDELVISFETEHNDCAGEDKGSIDLTVSGGTPPYDYLWSNGNTDQDPGGLIGGTYTVTVTDENGCTATDSETIEDPLALEVSIEATPDTCETTACEGEVDLSVSGGTPPYSYSWSNGATTQDVSDLCSPGPHSVTVTDANGCTYIANDLLPPCTPGCDVNLQIDSADPLCPGTCDGSATANASNGTAPYSYSWSNGLTSQTISDLCEGQYCVTVTDANGCTATDCIVLQNPTNIVCNVKITKPTCYGDCDGSIDVTTNFGTPPYTYLWSNGATTQDVSSLCAGIYCVTTTDANGCTKVRCLNVTQPSQLIAIISSVTQDDCQTGALEGAIDISVSGGTTPYEYLWSNGATTQDLSGLAAGTYSVTVTDKKDCIVIIEEAIVSCVPNCEDFSADIEITDPLCPGSCDGELTAVAIAGIAPFTYNWSNGGSVQTISGLCEGQYCVTITDASGCTAVECAVIENPPNIVCNVKIKKPKCYGDCNGAIDVTTNFGTPPYTYLWSNGATTQDINGLCAGIYCVTTTDANGCSKVRCLNVKNPQLLSAIISSVTQDDCETGALEGAIDISVSGGVPPYTYLWSNGATTQDVSGLFAGTYSVTVTDKRQCITIIEEAIVPCSPPPPGCDGFKTITQGGWGQCQQNGNNPGQYLADHFDEVWPTELVIGTGCTYTLTFTSSTGVCEFLPSGSTPTSLTQSWVDPGSALTNVLAGQVSTLAVTLGFDYNIADFAPSNTNLGDLVVVDGTFAGWTVQEMFNEAVNALNGCGSSYSYSDLNGAIDAINNNYDNGTVDNGYLECPEETRLSGAGTETDLLMNAYPNPFTSNATIEFERLGSDGLVTVELYTVSGINLGTLFNGNVKAEMKYFVDVNGQDLVSGVYFYTVSTDGQTHTGKLLLVK